MTLLIEWLGDHDLDAAGAQVAADRAEGVGLVAPERVRPGAGSAGGVIKRPDARIRVIRSSLREAFRVRRVLMRAGNGGIH